jgi:chromosome segregation ATPase
MYRFFTRATKLDEIHQTYVSVEEEIGKYEALKSEKEQELEEHQEELDFLKKKWRKEKQRLWGLVKTTAVDKPNKAVNVKTVYNESQSMLNAVTQNLERIEEVDISESDVYQEYTQAKAEVESAEDMIEMIGQEIESLHGDLKVRKKKLKKSKSIWPQWQACALVNASIATEPTAN